MSQAAGWLAKAPLCGASSKPTLATPEPPPSPVLDVSVTEPCTGLPGLCIVTLGGVLSIRRAVTAAGAASAFPATSVEIERKS